MGKFIPSFSCIVSALLTVSIAQGALQWLGQNDIYPAKWVAGFFGMAEAGVTDHPGISLMLVGFAGLIGLFIFPLIYKLVAIKIFGYKNDLGRVRGEKSPVRILQQPAFITFIPKEIRVIDANNIRNLDYLGDGEFTIDFTNPIEGDFEVKSQKTDFTVIVKANDSVSIRLENEQNGNVTLVFSRLSDGDS